MNLIFVIIYLILSFLSPADLFPVLGPYRPMLVLTAIGMMFALMSLMNHPEIIGAPQLWLMACFYGVIIIVYPLNGWLGGALVSLSTFSVQVVTLVWVITAATSVDRVRWIGWSMVVISLYYFTRGVLAIHFGIGRGVYTVFQWYDESGASGTAGGFDRLKGAGFVSDPNDLAQVFLLSLPFLWLAWKKRAPVNNLVFVLIPATLIFYGLYMTASRGSLVGLFVLVAFAFKDRLGIGGPILGGMFTSFLFLVVGFGGGRAISASGGTGGGRLELWSDAIGIFIKHPIWGIGYNGITEWMPLTAHNSFVLCFTELGLLGYFFWLALLVVTIIPLRRIAKQTKSRQGFEELYRTTRAVLLSLYVFLATGWFLSRTYASALYLVLALGGGLILQARERGLDGTELTVPDLVKKTVGVMCATIVVIYVMVRLRWA